MDLFNVPLPMPEGSNIVLGQSHFIKTVEDLYEVMVTRAGAARFGIAFSEASGPCLIRSDGNDDELTSAAVDILRAVAAGHCFVVVLRDAFPISVLDAIKACQEVCGIYCATANPVEAIVAQTDLGRAILGVVDGSSPKGVEDESDVAARKSFLRKIGYKR